MTFLAPGYLLAAGLAALGAFGLHLLSTREPRPEPLPTARFVPETPVRALRLVARLSDVPLLLLRILIVLLVGAALARPVWTLGKDPLARIVVVDVSRAVGEPLALVDSARTALDGADIVLLFDEAVREVPAASAADTLAAWAEARTADQTAARAGGDPTPAPAWSPAMAGPGSLTAALIAARRAGSRLRDRVEAVELVIIAAFVEEQIDEATRSARALWPGGIRAVVVPPATDAVRAAGANESGVRIEWADSGATRLWSARATPDTVSAVGAGDVVLVHAFERAWEPRIEAFDDDIGTATDEIASAAPSRRVYARWVDGEPAALEWIEDDVCVRSFGFAVPDDGDVRLRPAFQRFLAGLSAPCGEPPAFEPIDEDVMHEIAGPAEPAPATELERAELRATSMMPWLLAAALVLALLELAARRARGRRQEP